MASEIHKNDPPMSSVFIDWPEYGVVRFLGIRHDTLKNLRNFRVRVIVKVRIELGDQKVVRWACEQDQSAPRSQSSYRSVNKACFGAEGRGGTDDLNTPFVF